SGVGLDLTNESGVMQSTFAVLADRFAVMHAANGNPTTVFSVQGGTSILNSAMIGTASIQAAKFSDWLESDAKGPDGVPVLRINFRTGEILMNSPTADGGRMMINNQLIRVIDANGVLRVRLG